MAEAPRPVSGEELKVAYSGPAIASNRFYVTMTPNGVRIAFCEQYDDQIIFRTAAVMSPQDALALRDVISVVLRDIEQQLVEITGKKND